MVKDRLKVLQDKAGISFAEWSKVSDVPETTIRKILSGETPDPRHETVCKLTYSLGGSLDDMFSNKKENEIESNAVLVLKEAYEARIEALRERVEDIKKYAETLHKDKKTLTIAVIVLVAIMVGILIFDISLDTNGWLRH